MVTSSVTWVTSVTTAGTMLDKILTVTAAMVVVSSCNGGTGGGGGVFWLPGSDMLVTGHYLTLTFSDIYSCIISQGVSLILLDMS